MPAALAYATPAESGRLETTRPISAGYSRAFAASTSAAMFEPRPEIRTATRFLRISSPGEFEVPGIRHLGFTGFELHDRAEFHGGLARAPEGFGNRICA